MVNQVDHTVAFKLAFQSCFECDGRAQRGGGGAQAPPRAPSTFLPAHRTHRPRQARGGGGLDVEAPEGNGSGVVWDADGHVVTNYHVLASSMAKLGVEKDAGGLVGTGGRGAPFLCCGCVGG